MRRHELVRDGRVLCLKRFARKIDLVLTDEQMDARNEARMEAARAAGQVSD